MDFKLHDFGFRGVSSVETAGVGGAAHLVSFRGTDTFEGIMVARDYYGEPMAGFSIPAAEHSTITAWGREHEVDAMRNMLEQFPDGTGGRGERQLRHLRGVREDLGADAPRPGAPPRRLRGDPARLGRPASRAGLRHIRASWTSWPRSSATRPTPRATRCSTRTSASSRATRVDFDMLDAILYAMQKAGFSADNIAFGSGGGLLQKLNRDTLKFAFKCAAVVVDGQRAGRLQEPGDRSRQTLEERADETGEVSGPGRARVPHRPAGGARRGPTGRSFPRRYNSSRLDVFGNPGAGKDGIGLPRRAAERKSFEAERRISRTARLGQDSSLRSE